MFSKWPPLWTFPFTPTLDLRQPSQPSGDTSSFPAPSPLQKVTSHHDSFKVVSVTPRSRRGVCSGRVRVRNRPSSSTLPTGDVLTRLPKISRRWDRGRKPLYVEVLTVWYLSWFDFQVSTEHRVSGKSVNPFCSRTLSLKKESSRQTYKRQNRTLPERRDLPLEEITSGRISVR